MTTLIASAQTLTVSVRFSTPAWLIRMARRAQARSQHRLLQQLTPEQQRDIGHFAAPTNTLPSLPWS